MKNTFKKLAVVLAFIACSCDFNSDLADPNQLPQSGADVDYMMNYVQAAFADFFSNAQGTTAPLMRFVAMSGGYRYQTAYLPQFQDGLWQGSYQGVLVQTKALIPLAQAKNLTTHVAVAKILNAYTLMTLVDLFGDVPLTEALDPTNFSPKADGGSDVYNAALTLLTEAQTELAKTGIDAGAALGRDIYYGGDRSKWNILANTLKLKAYVNLGDNTNIANFIDTSTGAVKINIIDAAGEEFTYKYGTATTPAGSRHPLYDQYYGPAAGSAGGYIANYFLYEMFKGSDYTTNGVGTGSAIQDPRWRYYFYRQVGSVVAVKAGFDFKAIGCTPGAPPPNYAGVSVFCDFEPGFYGRDHGDASGTPPDGPVITCAGVYPAGGRPDLNATSGSAYNKPTKRLDGANGAGIQPIWLPFYTDFLIAQIVVKTDIAKARTLLLTAVGNSIGYVKSFADGKGQSVTLSPWTSVAWTPGAASLDGCASLAPATGQAPSNTYLNCRWNDRVEQYKTAVGLAYDNASSKMDIIGKETWKSLWGNGLEAYNLYRRTSAPKNMQPTLQVNPGPWMRRLVYPSAYVNLNQNATQLDPNVVNKVFWDTNPDVLN